MATSEESNTLEPFATVADLEEFWRELNKDEESRAEVLLKSASNKLRLVGTNNKIDIGQRIKDDVTGVYGANVKDAVLTAVRRAMTMPTDMPDVESWAQSANPYSETIKPVDSSGDVYFKKKDYELLGLGPISGKSQIGVLEGVQ